MSAGIVRIFCPSTSAGGPDLLVDGREVSPAPGVGDGHQPERPHRIEHRGAELPDERAIEHALRHPVVTEHVGQIQRLSGRKDVAESADGRDRHLEDARHDLVDALLKAPAELAAEVDDDLDLAVRPRLDVVLEHERAVIVFVRLGAEERDLESCLLAAPAVPASPTVMASASAAPVRVLVNLFVRIFPKSSSSSVDGAATGLKGRNGAPIRVAHNRRGARRPGPPDPAFTRSPAGAGWVIEISGTKVMRKMTPASIARNGSISSAIRSTRSPDRLAATNSTRPIGGVARPTVTFTAHDDGEMQRIDAEPDEGRAEHRAEDQDRGSRVQEHPDDEEQDVDEKEEHQRVLADAEYEVGQPDRRLAQRHEGGEGDGHPDQEEDDPGRERGAEQHVGQVLPLERTKYEEGQDRRVAGRDRGRLGRGEDPAQDPPEEDHRGEERQERPPERAAPARARSPSGSPPGSRAPWRDRK